MNFAHLYKSAVETKVKLVTTEDKLGKPKRKKMKSNLITPQTEGEIENKADENRPSNNVKNKKARKKDKTKCANNNMETVPNAERGEIKPKKRNKSVSFMLDDKEEVAVKKTKSDITATHKQSTINNESNVKKTKKNKKTNARVESDEVEINKKNYASNSIEKINNLKRSISEKLDNEESDPTERKINKKTKKNAKGKESGDSKNVNEINKTNEIKKKLKHKEVKTAVRSTDEGPSVEIKNSKEKKQPKKPQNNETEINPDKSHKNENKPEVIAGNLENLTIGDNTHTISNLLDEMTVVDKKKQKKNINKKMNDKQPAKDSTEEGNDIEEEGKEKEIWQKKRWNKGKKGDNDPDKGLHPVNVEDLPISIILSYKKLLAEHFARYGTVRKVGIAQIYPSESTKPVFNTTVHFNTAADAIKALEEDNTSLAGSTIRVLRPFPALETTAVVRTYGPLSEQIISTLFSNVGRIQRIRHVAKGKKSMSTAFIELDKPEAVERAIKMADEVRIGGKRVHVSKYQVHQKIKKGKKKHKTTDKVDKELAVNDDSDGSND